VSGIAILQAMLIAGVLFTFAALVGTIHYRITPDAVEVLTLGRVARRIPLADIVEVHRRGALLHENWSGPRFWNAVTIRRRRGLIRNIVISPDDPDCFIDRLAATVRQSTGRPLTDSC
jgi:hypothetical protein